MNFSHCLVLHNKGEYEEIKQVTLVATGRLTLDWTYLNIIYRYLLDFVMRTIAELTQAYEKIV